MAASVLVLSVIFIMQTSFMSGQQILVPAVPQSIPSGVSQPYPSNDNNNSGQSAVEVSLKTQPFFGTISDISDSNLDLSLQNGSSLDVKITDKTQFIGGTKENLSNGVSISGIGTSTTNGTLLASLIQINPDKNSG